MMRVKSFSVMIKPGMLASAVVLAGTALVQTQGQSSDWPQWRGPKRDGAVATFREPRSWPSQLTEKWKVDVGLGYATPILVGNRVFTYTRRGDNEVLAALDVDTGKSIWQTSYPAPFTMNPAAARHGPGPKSTPTYANAKLFTLGMGGVVTAFDVATGKQLWQKPAPPVGPLYGTAMSPLVDGDAVIVHVGGHNQGALTAFRINTGDVKWSWNVEGPAYGSPIAVDVDGVRQVITFTQESLVGVSATTGELLWKRPFTTPSTQNTMTPIVYGQMVIVSGLNNPVTAFRIVKQGAQWTTENVWQNPDVPMYMTNAVLFGDSLFGMTNRNSGQFFTLDAKTGKTLWISPPRQATNTAIVRAGDLAFVLKDDGELLVGRADQNGFQVSHQYKVADSSTWAQPVVSGNQIFVKDESKLTLWTF